MMGKGGWWREHIAEDHDVWGGPEAAWGQPGWWDGTLSACVCYLGGCGVGVGHAVCGLQGSCALLGTKFLTALESLVTPWGATGGVISQ